MGTFLKFGQVVLLLPALTFSGTLFAAGQMSAAEVTHLLANNTMHCSNLQKGEAFTNYFRDDGTVTRLTAEGGKIQGTWRVTDDGQHCLDWGEHERCNPVVDQGNGTYQKIEDDKPRTEFTVSDGNPKGL
ncbi:MAG: hypothetical protein WBQ78_10015 [Gammaproteobacteria bacterium]